MTKAPERAVLHESPHEIEKEFQGWWHIDEGANGLGLGWYIPEDHALALVAAENEACAQKMQDVENVLSDILNRLDEALTPPDGGLTMHSMGQTPDWFVEAAHASCYSARTIRARTPDDATAALERVKQEAFQEGYEQAKADETAAIIAARREVAEQAAKLADEWYHNSGHGSPGDEIRAALQQGKEGE